MNGLLRTLGTVVALVFVVGLPILGGPLAQRLHPPPAPQPGCEIGQWPEFRHGFAELRQALDSSIMGDAIECEHALDAAGNTDQATTTGTAHYDRTTNIPSFTIEHQHWALTAFGLVLWTGEDRGTVVTIASPGVERLGVAAARNSAPLSEARLYPTPVVKPSTVEQVLGVIRTSNAGLSQATDALQSTPQQRR
jgi:hypothetical protein